jgi:hypothetical protein
MRKNPFIAIFLTICLLILGAGWSLAEEIKLNDGQSIVGFAPQTSAAEIKAFWTEERMFQALQNPLTKEILTENLKMKLDADEPTGELKTSPPYCPDCPQNQSDYSAMGEPEPGSTVSAPCPASGYSWDYDYANSNYPERVVGRLFMVTNTGGLASCSASLVNRRLLLTAGHCVCNGSGSWYSNFYFSPGHKNGSEPYGRGYAANLYVYSDYLNTGVWALDIAMIILTADMGNSLGWLGYSTGRNPADQLWLQFGYPAQNPFDGNWLVSVLSRMGYRVSGIGSPYPVAVGSIFTPGASGGPWIVTSGSNLYANGLNSAKPTSCAETTISPYFGDLAWNLYIYARDRQP